MGAGGVPLIAPICSIAATWPKHLVGGGVKPRVPSGIIVAGPGGARYQLVQEQGNGGLLSMSVASPIAMWPIRSPCSLYQGRVPRILPAVALLLPAVATFLLHRAGTPPPA